MVKFKSQESPFAWLLGCLRIWSGDGLRNGRADCPIPPLCPHISRPLLPRFSESQNTGLALLRAPFTTVLVKSNNLVSMILQKSKYDRGIYQALERSAVHIVTF